MSSKTFQIVADFSREKELLRAGHDFIAGVDEVGRGPFAGPVVASAVILDPKNILIGLADSKRLSLKKRLFLYDKIFESALSISVVSLCAEYIDRHNILNASLEAMRRCLNSLFITPDYALIDGKQLPDNLPCPALAIVKGDMHCASIAVASIVAKVTRDKMFGKIEDVYPYYGFKKHVGYGTAMHREMLRVHGPLPRIHRYSFAPIKEFAGKL